MREFPRPVCLRRPGCYGPPKMVEAPRRRVTGAQNLQTIRTGHVEPSKLTTRAFIER